uniref:Reverse transcriptase domain-containing protein n=1 Tax=Cannabis sativa TaxID=3483 RepID=A0A803PKG2_CANSA
MVLGCYGFGLGENRIDLASPFLPEVISSNHEHQPEPNNHSLQLTAEEALIHDFDHVSIHPETQPDSNCLVVKILTPKTPKPNWIGNAMKDAWIARFPFTFTDYHSGLFLCHGLAHFIADTIGDLIEVHLASLYDSITLFMRIRVLLDTTKPLFRCMNIHFRKLSLTKWVKFQCEGLQNYCYNCGKLDHTFNWCENFLHYCVTHAHPPSLSYKHVLRAPAKSFYKKSIFELSNSTPFEEIQSLNNVTSQSLQDAVDQSLVLSIANTASVFNSITCPINSSPIITSTVLISTSQGKAPMYPESTRVNSKTPPEPIHLRARVAHLNISGSKRTYTRQSSHVGKNESLKLECSWIGDSRAFQNLSLLVQQHRPMILFVMETKLAINSIILFKAKLSFDNVFEVPRQGLGGGFNDKSSPNPPHSHAMINFQNFITKFDLHPFPLWEIVSPGSMAKFVKDLKGITRCITPDQFYFLSKDFDFSEVKSSLFQISGDKAPSLDGLNPLFYQKNLNILGHSFGHAVLDVLNKGASISSINATYLVLVPKKSNATKVRDFRPISLCSTIYKVVAKSIANRLKTVLTSLISHNQGAFHSNRIIFNNILIANEVNNSINGHKNDKVGWAALKLDMEKAFDKVEWGLSAIIHLKEHASLFKGVSICRSVPSISHLLFADDSLLFTHVSHRSSHSIHDVLTTYNKATGQSVNFAKSSVICSPNTSPQDKSSFLSSLGMVDKPFIDTYFGVPQYFSRSKKSSFHFILQRASSKLSIWNSKLFSKAGKKILLKAAMLAKQAWRVFQHPSSLLATLLKAKYFKHSDFLQASLGHSPSFSWRSLIWGRNLLLKGLVWKIGDGKSISTLSPNWWPGYTNPCYKDDSQPPENNVSYFINDNGSWDLHKLNSYFDKDMIQSILAIPTNPPSKGYLIWGHDSSGILTVNFAYHLANYHHSSPSSSNPNTLKCWWKSDWSSNIPPKIKHFIWKAFYHLLPSNLNLFSRRALDNPYCILCLNKVESNSHSLLECSRADKKPNDQEIEPFIHSYLQEYNEAQTKVLPVLKFSQGNSSTNVTIESFQPPSGFYKLSVDATTQRKTNKQGFGAVVQDRNRQIIAGFYSSTVSCTQPIFAEAEALSRALTWCSVVKFPIGLIVLDCQVLINKIIQRRHNFSALSDRVWQIISSLSLFPNASICFIHGSLNILAHNLAQQALGTNEEVI